MDEFHSEVEPDGRGRLYAVTEPTIVPKVDGDGEAGIGTSLFPSPVLSPLSPPSPHVSQDSASSRLPPLHSPRIHPFQGNELTGETDAYILMIFSRVRRGEKGVARAGGR